CAGELHHAARRGRVGCAPGRRTARRSGEPGARTGRRVLRRLRAAHGRACEPERRRHRRRRVRVCAPRALRAPPRRRLGARPRLDERHLRERRPDRRGAPARARRRDPRRRDRPEVRSVTVVGDYAAKTDTGKKRRRNEDAFVLAPPLFAVADGMGGAQAGEIASKLAAAALEDTDPGRLTGPERVASLIQEANRRVHERSSVDPATSGMGTTMTVALVEDDNAILDAVERHRDNLDRLTKQLVSAANRGGGEDNITVVAFSIGERDGGDIGDTATMQAVTLPVDDETTEDVAVRASSEAVLAGPSAVRVRVVLATLIVL